MPLRAFWNSEELLAPLISKDEWNIFKKQKLSVILPCCNSPGYLRNSKKGFQHFVHRKKSESCPLGKETWQHLMAKTEIARACQKMGYFVEIEAQGDNWRADVLASKKTNNKSIKIAFEVQWSKQTLEETHRRQEKYTQENIRCCWIFQTLPTSSESYATPMFLLSIDDNIMNISIGSQKVELYQFIIKLLSRKIKFCSSYSLVPQQKIKILFFNTKCWRCNKQHYVYVPRGSYTSFCGQEIIGLSSGYSSQFNSSLVKAAIACLNTEKAQAKNMRMGTIKKRKNKKAQKSVMSFGCPYCDAIVGASYYLTDLHYLLLGLEDFDTLEFDVTVNANLDFLEKPSNSPHWCFSENHSFCC